MAKVELSERYVKADDIEPSENVTFTIIEEPVEVMGNYGKKVEARISLENGDEKVKAKWGISNTNKDRLIKGISDETTDWIGKKLKVHVETINGKKAIILDPEQF